MQRNWAFLKKDGRFTFGSERVRIPLRSLRKVETEKFASWLWRVFGLVLWRIFREEKDLSSSDGWMTLLSVDHVHINFGNNITAAAESLAYRLSADGISCRLDSHDECHEDNHAVVLSAPVPSVPASVKYFTYQLEPLGFTPNLTGRYLRTLARADGIFEYSPLNLTLLGRMGFASSRVLHAPVCPRPVNHRPAARSFEERDIDVLFFGWMRSRRRQSALRYLRQRVNVVATEETFGAEMNTLISHARVVVNIHFVKDTRLEQVRLAQVMTASTPIVTEWAEDLDLWCHKPALEVVEQGDWEAMAIVAQELSRNRDRWLQASHQVGLPCSSCG